MQSSESLGVLRLIFPSSRAGRWPVIGWKHLGGPWPLSDFYRELSSGCITDWKGSDTTWELRMGTHLCRLPLDRNNFEMTCHDGHFGKDPLHECYICPTVSISSWPLSFSWGISILLTLLFDNPMICMWLIAIYFLWLGRPTYWSLPFVHVP